MRNSLVVAGFSAVLALGLLEYGCTSGDTVSGTGGHTGSGTGGATSTTGTGGSTTTTGTGGSTTTTGTGGSTTTTGTGGSTTTTGTGGSTTATGVGGSSGGLVGCASPPPGDKMACVLGSRDLAVHEELRPQRRNDPAPRPKAVRVHYLNRGATVADGLGLQQFGSLRLPADVRQDLLRAHAGAPRLPRCDHIGNDDLHEHQRARRADRCAGRQPSPSYADFGYRNPKSGLLRLHQRRLAVRQRRGMAHAAVGHSSGRSAEAHRSHRSLL